MFLKEISILTLGSKSHDSHQFSPSLSPLFKYQTNTAYQLFNFFGKPFLRRLQNIQKARLVRQDIIGMQRLSVQHQPHSLLVRHFLDPQKQHAARDLPHDLSLNARRSADVMQRLACV